jgi:hypothetical protein
VCRCRTSVCCISAQVLCATLYRPHPEPPLKAIDATTQLHCVVVRPSMYLTHPYPPPGPPPTHTQAHRNTLTRTVVPVNALHPILR